MRLRLPATGRPRGLRFWAFYGAGVGLLAAAAVEVTSMVILRRRQAMTSAVGQCILCDAENVFTSKARHTSTWATPEFQVTVRTNTRGYREDFEFPDSSVDVAFMGDSFTFGHGVDVEQRYSNRVAARFPGRTIVSLARNNGNQPEHYEYFLGLHPELRPRLVVVGLYLGNDLDTDVRETVVERSEDGRITSLRLPYRRIYNGATTVVPQYRFGMLNALVEATNTGKAAAMFVNRSYRLRAALARPDAVIPNAPNRRSTELGRFDALNLRAVDALERINRHVRSRGGALHVLLIPQNFLVGPAAAPHVASPDWLPEIVAQRGMLPALSAICLRRGLTCHDLSPVREPADYFPADAHWRPSGHARAADVVAPIVAAALATASLPSSSSQSPRPPSAGR
jgi:hypothetical protein